MAGLALAFPGRLDQPTGGYRYDGQLLDALGDAGWEAVPVSLPASLPWPGPGEAEAAAEALAARPAGEPAIVDGLALGGLPRQAGDIARQRPLLALIHHPLGDEAGLSPEAAAQLTAAEGQALAACHGILAPSAFVARRLAVQHGLPAEAVTVVPPGPMRAALAGPARGRGDAVRLLCVANLIPRKGQDILVEALGQLAPATPWRLDLVGPTGAPAFAQRVAERAHQLGLAERLTWNGPASDAQLAAFYADAELLVLPSRYEGYGLVVDEALAAGLPVLATDGGALAETANRPGCRQVPSEAPAALAAALAELIDAPAARAELAQAAGLRGGQCPWSDSAARAGRAVEAARQRWQSGA